MTYDPRMKSDEGSGASPVEVHDNPDSTPPLRTHDHRSFIEYDPKDGIPNLGNMHNYRRDPDGVWRPSRSAQPEIHVTEKGHEELFDWRKEIGLEVHWESLVAGVLIGAGFILILSGLGWLP